MLWYLIILSWNIKILFIHLGLILWFSILIFRENYNIYVVLESAM